MLVASGDQFIAMRDRSAGPARARRPATISIEVVLCAPHGRTLGVLFTRSRDRDRWTLPHAAYIAGEAPGDTAARIARRALGVQPACLEPCVVLGDRNSRATATMSVGFVGVTFERSDVSNTRAAWFASGDLPKAEPRHSLMVKAAVDALRGRMDFAPIAFGLLPATFTLGALQAVYELLLGRRLHKANFRRALRAARVVKPTALWHKGGRGRPAQLFRYVPRRPNRARRNVRFDLLGAA